MSGSIRSTIQPLDAVAPTPVSTPRYYSASRHLHWLMAALVGLAYLLIEGRGWFSKGSTLKTLFVQGHFWVGLLVLALVLPRLLARFRHPAPDITPPLPPAVRWLSSLTHYALYGFLVLQPLMGMLVVFLERGGLPLGSLTIASPFELNKTLAHQLEGWHVGLGTAFYAVIGLHILAAIWHHFYLRDNVLKRML